MTNTDGWETVGAGEGHIVKLGEKEGQVGSILGRYEGEETGKYGPLYLLRQADGSLTKLAHNSAVEMKLKDYTEQYGASPVGKVLRFTFEGMRPTKDGTKTYKSMSLDVREDFPAETAPNQGDEGMPF